MANLDQFIRSFTLFLGITPPKPGQERRVAIILAVTITAVIFLTLGLVLGMVRFMYQ
jgi:hypothetical protein